MRARAWGRLASFVVLDEFENLALKLRITFASLSDVAAPLVLGSLDGIEEDAFDELESIGRHWKMSVRTAGGSGEGST